MFKVMFEIGLALLGSLISLFWSIFTYPLYALLDGVLPSVTTAVSNVTTFINGSLLNGISYFFSMFPPTTKLVLTFWFSCLLAFFTIYLTYCAIYFTYHIVCKITDIIT